MAGMPKRRARRNPSQPRDPRTGQFVSRRNPSGIRDMTPYDKEFLALYQALPAQAPGLAGHGIYMGIDRFADAVMEKGYATADDVRQLKRRIANLKQAKENPSFLRRRKKTPQEDLDRIQRTAQIKSRARKQLSPLMGKRAQGRRVKVTSVDFNSRRNELRVGIELPTGLVDHPSRPFHYTLSYFIDTDGFQPEVEYSRDVLYARSADGLNSWGAREVLERLATRRGPGRWGGSEKYVGSKGTVAGDLIALERTAPTRKNPSYDLPPHLHRVDGAGGRTVIVVEEEYEGEPDYVVLVYLPSIPEGINWDAHGSLRSAKRIADRVARQKKL